MASYSRKVLVVDDDIGILESFDFMLRDRCRLTLAENGKDALRSLESEKPELVFLDIRLPDINGLDILRDIRMRYPGLEVVIITSSEQEENMEIATRLGVEGYLKKPIDAFDIIKIVDSIPS